LDKNMAEKPLNMMDVKESQGDDSVAMNTGGSNSKDLSSNGLTTSSPSHEYAESVRQWLWQRQWAQQMNWYMYMTYSTFAMNCASMNYAAVAAMTPTDLTTRMFETGNGSSSSTGQAGTRGGNVAAGSRQEQQNVQPQPGGREYTLPAVWRRVVAECLDFFLLFTMKLGASLIALDYIGLVDIERYELENLLAQDWDSNTALAITAELVAMEMVNRIFVCIFETLCLWRGYRGATPGKRVLRLQVIACQEIHELPGNKVRITPAGNLSLWNALLRSLIKNFSMAVLFPVCLSVFFSPHKRASYDILAGSIVVEDDVGGGVWPRLG